MQNWSINQVWGTMLMMDTWCSWQLHVMYLVEFSPFLCYTMLCSCSVVLQKESQKRRSSFLAKGKSRQKNGEDRSGATFLPLFQFILWYMYICSHWAFCIPGWWSWQDIIFQHLTLRRGYYKLCRSDFTFWPYGGDFDQMFHIYLGVPPPRA